MGEQKKREEVHAEARRCGEKAAENGLSSPLEVCKRICFGDICTRVQDTVIPSSEGCRVYLGLEHLVSGFPSLLGKGTESDVKSGKTAFKSNDILFGKLRPYLRKSVRIEESGVCSTDILVFRAKAETDPKYLCYLTHTDEFIRHAVATTSGVNHPRTSWASLKDFQTVIPPLAEQRSIAAVLEQVQKAIEEQEKLLALTAELKRTLLHQLFTRGLRNEPQKQTDIGPIPESWEVVPLTELFYTQLGKMLSQKAHGGDEPKPYLRNKNVQWGAIDTTDLLDMDFDERERKKFILCPGDLLVCEGGEPGRAAIWHGELEECYYQKALHRLRPKDQRTTNQFLYHWLTFAFRIQNVYGVSGASSTIAHMPEAQLKMLAVPLPLRTHQDEICETLNSVDNRLLYLKQKHTTLSDLFRALLHQLMTGQIACNNISQRLEVPL